MGYRYISSVTSQQGEYIYQEREKSSLRSSQGECNGIGMGGDEGKEYSK